MDHDVLAKFGQVGIADPIACTVAADQVIIPCITLQRIIARTALQRIMARAAQQFNGKRVADDEVIAFIADRALGIPCRVKGQNFEFAWNVEVNARHNLITARTRIFQYQIIGTFYPVEIVAQSAFKNILPGSAGQGIITATAQQVIITIIAAEAIIACTAEDVVPGLAAQYGHRSAGSSGIYRFEAGDPGAIGRLILVKSKINEQPSRENEPIMPMPAIKPIGGILQDQAIVAATALKRIGPVTTYQAIATIAVNQPIMPCATFQDIGTVSAIEKIIAIAAQQPILPCPAKEPVIASFALQQIGCLRCIRVIQGWAIGIKRIMAIATQQPIIPGTAPKLIGTAKAENRICIRTT